MGVPFSLPTAGLQGAPHCTYHGRVVFVKPFAALTPPPVNRWCDNKTSRTKILSSCSSAYCPAPAVKRVERLRWQTSSDTPATSTRVVASSPCCSSLQAGTWCNTNPESVTGTVPFRRPSETLRLENFLAVLVPEAPPLACHCCLPNLVIWARITAHSTEN